MGKQAKQTARDLRGDCSACGTAWVACRARTGAKCCLGCLEQCGGTHPCLDPDCDHD